MKEEIESALGPLVGLPMWGSHRAADMECFKFGAMILSVIRAGKRKGDPTVVGQYALHLQCAWRLDAPSGIVAARRDYWYPAGDDPHAGLDDFDPDGPEPDRRSELLKEFWKRSADDSPRVRAVIADEVGGFRVTFSGGIVLTAFPDDSLDGEHWRLLQPGNLDSHFVVTGAGIER